MGNSDAKPFSSCVFDRLEWSTAKVITCLLFSYTMFFFCFSSFIHRMMIFTFLLRFFLLYPIHKYENEMKPAQVNIFRMKIFFCVLVKAMVILFQLETVFKQRWKGANNVKLSILFVVLPFMFEYLCFLLLFSCCCTFFLVSPNASNWKPFSWH